MLTQSKDDMCALIELAGNSCRLLADYRGDFSSKRIILSPRTLVCISDDGQSHEIKVKGLVTHGPNCYSGVPAALEEPVEVFLSKR